MLAESIGERQHRHAIELASCRWRGGHNSAVAETRLDNLIYAQVQTSGVVLKIRIHGEGRLDGPALHDHALNFLLTRRRLRRAVELVPMRDTSHRWREARRHRCDPKKKTPTALVALEVGVGSLGRVVALCRARRRLVRLAALGAFVGVGIVALRAVMVACAYIKSNHNLGRGRVDSYTDALQ